MNIERINTALEFLKHGSAFTVEDLRIGMVDEDLIFVTGWTFAISIETLSKEQAIDELAQIKSLFTKMLDLSSELSLFVTKKILNIILHLIMGWAQSISVLKQMAKSLGKQH